MQTIYKCEGCGKEFGDWRVCSDHENEHVKIESSQLLFNQGDSHPTSVKIIFNDGSWGTYSQDGIITLGEKESPLTTANSTED